MLTEYAKKTLWETAKMLVTTAQMAKQDLSRFRQMIQEDYPAEPRAPGGLLTRRDVAEMLKVSVRSVNRLMTLGRLTPIRPLGGRAVRFAPSEVLAVAGLST